MGKSIDKGLVPPDDPMFTGGYVISSPHKSKPSAKTSPSGTAEEPGKDPSPAAPNLQNSPIDPSGGTGDEAEGATAKPRKLNRKQP